MLVDRTALVQHREAIQHDDEGWFVWGELERLWIACHLGRATGRDDLDELHLGMSTRAGILPTFRDGTGSWLDLGR
jgi:hypothetical protein